MAKQELFDIPFLGSLMRVSRYIPVKRGNKESIKQAMSMSEQTLNRNISMMIFPEGTRSKTHTLSPFKNGAFNLAQQRRCDIIPIILTGTCDLVTKGSRCVGKADVTINILGRVPYNPDLSLEELKASIFDMMNKAI